MKLELGPVDAARRSRPPPKASRTGWPPTASALKVDIEPDVGTFVGDERRVVQVLYNLLANAVGFSPQDSTVGSAPAAPNAASSSR